jgi:UDP-glucose 4-epimerase
MGSMRPKDFELDTKTVLDEFWTNINKLQSLLYNTKINKFLQISSAGTIYGEYNKSPSKETDIPNPISWYGRAKVLEELYYQNFAQIQNIDFLCTRVTNPYGNIHKTDHGFIDVLINSIINKKVFRTFVDENHSRDFIYAPDMAYMIVEFLLSGHTGTLNVASGNTIQLSKIIDYVQSINKSFKPNKDLVSLDFDVNNNKIDISHLKSLSLHRETNNIFDYIDANLRGLQHVQENKKYFE